MLDAVFNHIGENHPYWQDVLKNQEKSRYKDYFHIRRFPVKRGPQNRDDMDFDTFAFTPAMPKWNTENPEARKYLLDAAAYWIRECDIDAWRLDVANEVSFGFWDEFSRLVRSLKKEFYIVGEIWHDASNWIDRGEFDAAMNYPLEYAISNYFIRKTTSADQFTGRLILSLTRYSDTHNRIAFNLLDSHDTDRVLTRAGGDKLAVRNAFTILFLLPGSPCIYYGTEVGMAGGTDPDNRRPMIWNEAKQDKDLKSFFKTLIALRKKYIALINNSAIQYKLAAGLHCWELADGKSALNIVYSETAGAKAAYDMNELGQCLFNTEASDRNGELSPYSMAVCYKNR
jgi:neopullulanase